MRLYFIDPDAVEEKNLVGQNFCPAEIGQPKAFTLAWRYTAVFGLNIIPVIKPFSAEMLKTYQPRPSPQGTLTIIVGAVDNVCARRDDEWQGVLIQVRFCTACLCREDLCPQCGGEIDDFVKRHGSLFGT